MEWYNSPYCYIIALTLAALLYKYASSFFNQLGKDDAITTNLELLTKTVEDIKTQNARQLSEINSKLSVRSTFQIAQNTAAKEAMTEFFATSSNWINHILRLSALLSAETGTAFQPLFIDFTRVCSDYITESRLRLASIFINVESDDVYNTAETLNKSIMDYNTYVLYKFLRLRGNMLEVKDRNSDDEELFIRVDKDILDHQNIFTVEKKKYEQAVSTITDDFKKSIKNELQRMKITSD